jgi:hypothetical protein
MVNIKGILGIVFLILGIIFLAVLGFIGMNGFEIFGYSWWSIQYYMILLYPIGMLLVILGIIFSLSWRKKS